MTVLDSLTDKQIKAIDEAIDLHLKLYKPF